MLAPLAHADFSVEMAKVRSAPAKDVPLFTMQAGLAAIAEGKTREAAELFDGALAGIEGMFANTENAAKARSLWYEEGAKDFKGEPYERAMAFYYRGLLYLADGDYENARASFRGGLLQDAFAEEQQYRSDFAMLMLLEGWSNQLNGNADQAADAYAELQRLRPDWRAPAKGANLLVIAELGGSPRKLSDGISNHEIVYRRAKRTPERAITVQLDGKAMPLTLVDDVFFQASTRGGRPIDRIIDGKVAFQNTTETIGSALGTIASEGSVISAANGGGGGRILGALAAVGAISSIISVNVKPRADVRYWANLPETLHASSLNLRALPATVNVALSDADGNPVPNEQVRVQSWIDKNGNGLVWIKSRN
jgi:tetratricopeptide (TPR) repeat protein